ncbi:hypothetical protein ASD53_02365 [Lysobacter sp. Root559]|uniref:hypothetical protein n=1 Tax=Lysobacter sp. Root559 TaxID=1736559 RepID=UPI0006F21551|nr:hypothetical protein [Lysobacter sp. Root559]KQZ60028.1 hypothetical protein ASD53_02365 [Lysobacter sp. Root559]
MTERDHSQARPDPVDALSEALEETLLLRYGPMIGHDDLRQALGFLSMDAFRQALCRQQLPVPVFSIRNRRGKYALTLDVARWLAQLRAGAQFPAGNGVDARHAALGVTID